MTNSFSSGYLLIFNVAQKTIVMNKVCYDLAYTLVPQFNIFFHLLNLVFSHLYLLYIHSLSLIVWIDYQQVNRMRLACCFYITTVFNILPFHWIRPLPFTWFVQSTQVHFPFMRFFVILHNLMQLY